MVIETALKGRTELADSAADRLTQIKVVGVGGGGTNAVNRMIEEDIPEIDFVAVNTDAQALVRSIAPTRIRIGDRLTRGLGAGGDHTLGMLAAEESRDEVAKAMDGADMVFITAGMGGGTGTGAAPVVAEVAKALGILTIAIVTRPFTFEGVQRARVASEGIIRLEERADSLVVIPNERLLSMCDANVSIEAAFKMVDDVLFQSVHGISEVITSLGNINLDFNDVRTTMNEAGHAWISMGLGSGETRAVDAARAAIVSPLFDFSIDRAKRILFNIIYNELTLTQVNEAANVIREVADPNAQIIFGLATDPRMGTNVKLTLIATGFREGDSYEQRESLIIPDMPDDDDLPAFGLEDKRRSFFPWVR
ncbi:MAG: cell division protein FtsZ [Dehalococcoidia bacterium]